MQFQHVTFPARLASMLALDIRRLFSTRSFHVMLLSCLAIPVMILVITAMVGGEDAGFSNTWQILGTMSDAGPMAMDMTSMCNVNLLYFFVAIVVALLVTADFTSGYSKNLFALRAKKAEYAISKTVAGVIGGICMLLCFFVGSIIGGAVAGLPFDTAGVSPSGLVLCMTSKSLLMAAFVPLYTLLSIIFKRRSWLAMMTSFCMGTMMFMMIPALTPLDATVVNVLVCLVAGVVSSTVFCVISNHIINKVDLV